METPILSGSWYSLHRCSCTPSFQNEIGGIGQPVPGADLCRLFAYMGVYCIAHINRSNLSLPYVEMYVDAVPTENIGVQQCDDEAKQEEANEEKSETEPERPSCDC